MAALVPPLWFWPGLAGAGAAALTLAAPWWSGWNARRHARRLEARRARGYDLYFEELRELEAYPPQDPPRFGARTVAQAAGFGAIAAMWIYAMMLDDPQVDAAAGLLVAAAALIGALIGARRAWAQAGPDPRAMIFADRLSPEAAAARRLLLLRLAGSVGLAALGLLFAWQQGAGALEALL